MVLTAATFPSCSEEPPPPAAGGGTEHGGRSSCPASISTRFGLPEVELQHPGGRRRQGLGAGLVALAGEVEDAVTEVVGQVLDVAAEGLTDPEAVEGQQRDERSRAQPVGLGGGQQLDELLLVEAHRRGVIRHPRPLDPHDGGGVDDADVDDRVLVEA